MKKANLVKVLYAASFFVIAVLLVVGAIVGQDGGFRFGILDAIVYLAAAFSVVSLVTYFLLDRAQGALAAAYLCGVICFGVAIAIGLAWYIAIALMVAYLAVVFLVRTLCVKRQWDEGDNQKLGYKDYRTRKAEREAAEKNEVFPEQTEDPDKKD